MMDYEARRLCRTEQVAAMIRSVWHESVKEAPRPPAKPPEGNIKTDVLIIGGGMAGVLCAD